MIRLVGAADDALHWFCEGNPFGCRILSAAQSYPDAPFAGFWLQSDEQGRLRAAISRLDGDATVCCGILSSGEKEELCSFLQTVGVQSVFAPKGTLSGARISDSGVVLLLSEIPKNAEFPRKSSAGEFCLETSPAVREIFALFSSCSGRGFEFSATDAAYVDLSHRLRHRFCRVIGMKNEAGILCAAAMTTAESKTAALIGGVCTLPALRGKGLASVVVAALCGELKTENKKIFLFAERELIPFYGRLGFLPAGEWERESAAGI